MRRRVLLAVGGLLALSFAVDASAQSLRAQADAYARQAARSQGKDAGAEDDAAAQNRSGGVKASSIVLSALYGSAVVVHGLDAHSTFEALDAGAVETNVLLRPLTDNRPAFIAFKGGVAAGTIYAAHHMAKRNKLAAILTLAAVNTAYAFIVANNYRAAREMRAAQAR
jgi:hypothetical protein